MRVKAKKDNFLVEIHTEELPPKALSRLMNSFLQEMKDRLVKADLEFKEAESYATPRRLAVLVKGLVSHQPDMNVERRGPAVDAAFDASGQPTQACIGFARSCQTTPDKLTRIKNKQGEFVGFSQMVAGKTVQELIPGIVQEALSALPIPKRMRWGSGEVEFVRPVHSVILLYGNDVIDAEILGVRAGRETRGHRFLSKKTISISQPTSYLKRLKKSGHVIADFAERKAMILAEAKAIVQSSFGSHVQPVIPPALLDEVTGLVEWPVTIMGDFDHRFLTVPAEALICAMQDHQRYFAVVDEKGKLLPHFVAISNIESRDMQRVIAGNERVLRARLSDAAFFFETDKKQRLEARRDILKGIVFQAKLGSLYLKTERVMQLAVFIAAELGVGSPVVHAVQRAAALSKSDLTTEMVGEFPELQGLAGYYYATHDNESSDVANALNEQYMPRFSGDQLPASIVGSILALADRIDTLVGVFGINQSPTGDKDPFGLRRAALGVIRILIEKELNVDLRTVLRQAMEIYQLSGIVLENKDAANHVMQFIMERLKPWYQDQDINPDVYASVAALEITKPFDFHRRIQAVQAFKQLQDAESLSIANKRVSNILAKYENQIDAKEIDVQLFERDAERELASQLDAQSRAIAPMYQDARYVDVLSQLSSLRKPVDDFFDQVMVMTEDKKQRENRLLMLAKLRSLFLKVADVALLQTRAG